MELSDGFSTFHAGLDRAAALELEPGRCVAAPRLLKGLLARFSAQRAEAGAAIPADPGDPLLEDWYHTIDLGKGMVSKGYYDHRSIVDCYGIPPSLKGKAVLDVATGDGFFAFEMERRGAASVTAIDVESLGDCDWTPVMKQNLPTRTLGSTKWGDHFKMAHTVLGSKVKRVICDVYELSPQKLGSFDVVFCGDLLLHLKSPLQALINIRSVTRQIAVIETVLDPELEARFPDRPYLRFGALDAEERPGELNTYWRVNTKALLDMLAYAGFASAEPQGTFELPPHGAPVTSVVARVN